MTVQIHLPHKQHQKTVKIKMPLTVEAKEIEQVKIKKEIKSSSVFLEERIIHIYFLNEQCMFMVIDDDFLTSRSGKFQDSLKRQQKHVLILPRLKRLVLQR